MKAVGDIMVQPLRRESCDHAAAFVARNGALEQFGAWCDSCAQWVTQAVAWHAGLWMPKDHAKLAELSLESVPIRPVAFYRLCQRCREFGMCEVHHFAPRKLFGEACEAWPVAYLCKACHDAWHTTVTPGLCTAYDADAHARMIFDCIGFLNARALHAAIKAEGLRRKDAA